LTPGQDSPDISVVICAYTEQRWPDLVAAVESVQRQSVAPREIVLVVDHNPALHTRAEQQLAVRVVSNTDTQGLSGARNTGIAATGGALVAFLDDDAVAHPDWLAFLSMWHTDPEVMGAGGRLESNWINARPRWFPPEFDWVVGCSYRGLPTTTAPIRNPLGGSMCIRREVFATVGAFVSGIGRVGSRPFGCEETELAIRARHQWPKRVFLYEPRAIVRHTVPAERGQWRYFRSRCFAEGQSKAYVSRLVGAQDGLASERTHVFRTLPLGVVRGFADVLRYGDLWGVARSGAIIAGLAWTAAGYLTGRWSQRTSNPDAMLILEPPRHAA